MKFLEVVTVYSVCNKKTQFYFKLRLYPHRDYYFVGFDLFDFHWVNIETEQIFFNRTTIILILLKHYWHSEFNTRIWFSLCYFLHEKYQIIFQWILLRTCCLCKLHTNESFHPIYAQFIRIFIKLSWKILSLGKADAGKNLSLALANHL